MPKPTDAVVVGSGPNGLAAAIRLAQSGCSVEVREAAALPGGAVRSAELTLPGFLHDPFAAVFPLAVASPFFASLGLERDGLRWIEPAVPLAHPFDDGRAAVLYRSVEQTAAGLGTDERAYLELMRPLVADARHLIPDLLAPPRLPGHPLALARFGQHAIRSASGFACSHFHGDDARALLAGNAAHSFLSLDAPLTAGYGLFLGLLGHVVGWPIAGGGSGQLARALVARLDSLGGTVTLDSPVTALADLRGNDVVLFDTAPAHMARIVADQLPSPFRERLERHRMGPAAFKVDYALSGPVPWAAAACHEAGTLHLGGTLEEIADAERAVARGECPERPFVLASQPSLFDPTRAPEGQHTLWAYCHVPAYSDVDMTARIERQIERFAPGFRERILARHVLTPRDLQAANANLIGGAINGGVQDLRTYLRWTGPRQSPYATPNPGIYRCSAATPPGGGVHGMAGFHAAEAVLRHHAGHRNEKPSVHVSV
jgi:phytoene dehydrogenase-like protein